MTTDTAKLTAVTADDLDLVRRELQAVPRPLALTELAEKVAYHKTAGQRAQEVKRYDPTCRYEVGDLVFKEYDEALPVGSKHVEPFQGGVVLRVVAKTPFKAFHCEMLEVDYPGGGIFRKYLEYMKKTHTQVLLPSDQDGAGKAPEVLGRGDDPRIAELPMTERDLHALQKSLRTELGKSADLFGWNDQYQLADKRVAVDDVKIQAIAAAVEEAGHSIPTEDLVRSLWGLEPSSDAFDLHCLSLDATLDKKHKKDFVLMTDEGWGKWHLKRFLNAIPLGRPLDAPQARVPELETIEAPEMSVVHDFPVKVYLTWREILSGGVKLPRSLAKTMAGAREYVFTDPEEAKSYVCYYFPQGNYFLGLDDFYVNHNIPQGTSLTLERSGETSFNFWVKTSKKKIAVPRLAYDAESDVFQDTGEEVYSFAEPNKIIFMERETLERLLALTAERGDLDLRELLVLVFKDPALGGATKALHFLRAYHLVDMLRQTVQEDVESTLLNSPEFVKSDKKKGIFVYQEPTAEGPEIEIPAEEAYELPPEEAVLEGLPAEVEGMEEPTFEPELPTETAEEAEAPSEAEIELEERPRPSAPAVVTKTTTPSPTGKKEKVIRKKPKTEGDKGLRARKSERRVIEERIAQEESEAEALSAVKEKEEAEQEVRQREAKAAEEAEAAGAAEGKPSFGIFAEMLKSVLKAPGAKKKGGAEPQPQPEAAAAPAEPEAAPEAGTTEAAEPAEAAEEAAAPEAGGEAEPEAPAEEPAEAPAGEETPEDAEKPEGEDEKS